MLSISQSTEGITFPVMVQPRSSRRELAGVQEGALKIKLTAPPVEGKANEECVKFLAELLGVGKGRIAIVSGHKSRKKTVFIAGLGVSDLLAIVPEGS
jgi:uncharacterized protein